MSALSFYLDENVPTEVARQLRLRALHASYPSDAVAGRVFFLAL
ncbi:MAG TPA: hypothetical protein VGC93_11410 [Thermoanaerobaculia bacterium]